MYKKYVRYDVVVLLLLATVNLALERLRTGRPFWESWNEKRMSRTLKRRHREISRK
jgi:hypothetical protein